MFHLSYKGFPVYVLKHRSVIVFCKGYSIPVDRQGDIHLITYDQGRIPMNDVRLFNERDENLFIGLETTRLNCNLVQGSYINLGKEI